MPSPTPKITRQELAEYVQDTFATLGLVERHNLLNALERQGAPQQAVELVSERVPEGVRLAEMRALWHYLGDVPLEAAER